MTAFLPRLELPAQVFSTYQKGINTGDPASFVHAVNSIQLYYDGLRWWISCLVWEDLPKEGVPR